MRVRGLGLFVLGVVFGLAVASAAPLTRSIAPERVLDDDEVSARIADFAQWIKLKSIAPLVSIGFDEMRGFFLRAAEDIPKETEIASVSMSKIMSWRSAERTDVGAVMKAMPKSFDAATALVIHLLAESHAGARSEWAPYLALLPREFEIPLFWTHDELAELQASPLVASNEAELADVKASYERVIKPLMLQRPDLFPADAFSKRAYLWAKTVIWSRAMGLPLEAGKKSVSRALVPLLDFLNVNGSGNVRLDFTALVQKQRLFSTRDIEKGEELVLPARGSNADLLYTYGFVFESSPQLTYALPLTLAPDARGHELRVAVLRKHKFNTEDSAKLYVGDEVNADVLAFARMAHAPQGLLAAAAFDPYKPLASEVENAVLDKLRVELRALLDGYGTTAAEDDALLEAGLSRDDARRVMAIIARRDEKRVLEHNLRLLEEAGKTSAAPTPEL
eukprot:a341666_15.p1 GENE.a341666_15~~a341666_15.p1  ORF type:complete len:459 (-),score=216.82 a341666_15:25-1371(-)